MTNCPGSKPLCRFLLRVVASIGVLAMTAPACMAEITLTQANGNLLVLPAPAKSIITLAPNLAELVFAAGAGERLLAVGAYSDFPAEVKDIPQIGDAFRIDLERVLSLQPDLVIAWPSGNPQAALQKLADLGITVWQIEIQTPAEIAAVIDAIAVAAGTEAVGHAAAESLRQRLTTLVAENAHKAPLDFFYQIASEPLYTVSDGHIISRSLEVCGGRNIFANLPTLAPQIGRESVIQANPSVMIAAEVPGQAAALDGWLQWPSLDAVKQMAFVYLPADDISRAGPRLLDGIELACQRFDEIRLILQTGTLPAE